MIEKSQLRVLSLDQKRRVLMESGEYGEVVHALYHGGSQPGTKREIGPLNFVGRGAVRAWCLLTGTIKTYRLESLEIVAEDVVAPLYDPELDKRTRDRHP